ncbi:hypothetical protein SARC_08262 [Sphaeroforma arctica JP610]|uniref:Uncharacterized protein n=1 Tax=Sphaeroforma arctica JP610 TaxID=667725 RepID=A0A0L0FRM3_9EUKA|nr:hypothetical protein, variant [Sphaeroforma arctica JP610]XP_014153242.1 hypothetical protein SARC_08262 [Sphaeroforma arctica JP610]KNC79339.1 hypothetical protein, variant [Sphaeroforma arctica JP610]KNC79340.1 hypothetical protein SARC_08262 [Sphaeroforma arctica JP610]|eukprot:XP_014153241.1 hypothetical protein, variant [Sphaeroforma arctica JP610]
MYPLSTLSRRTCHATMWSIQRRPLSSNNQTAVKPGFRSMMKEYGKPFLVYWTGVWACTGVLTYGAVSYAGPDVALRGVQQLGVNTEEWDLTPAKINTAVAVAINEMLEPIRFPICVATTPMVVRFFRGLMRR